MCNDYTDAGLVCTHDTRMNCKNGCKNWKIKKRNWFLLIYYKDLASKRKTKIYIYNNINLLIFVYVE